jgi:hypothetical protein
MGGDDAAILQLKVSEEALIPSNELRFYNRR